ncbi:MAG: hypothetical protein EAZ89_00350 [Bacteroidetes bacterium]|nr:MAG: hypothetical protein EAZ89_00350 [Bacteroidota bacterium]
MSRLKNILIAESGSTKTDWQYLGQDGAPQSLRTAGLNPNSMSAEALRETLGAAVRQLGKLQPEQVFLYGSGISGAPQQVQMYDLLHLFFPHSAIVIHNDLHAALRVSGRNAGIVAILGTGSNACRYEAEQITLRRGGHGYLLGDEGSGTDLGKHLLKGCLQGDFEPGVGDYIQAAEGATLLEIRTSVYQSSRPGQRLSQLCPYVSDLIAFPAIREMVHARLMLFLETTICKMGHYEGVPADFVGSVAAHFRSILEDCCRQRGITMGEVYGRPAERLWEYHQAAPV